MLDLVEGSRNSHGLEKGSEWLSDPFYWVFLHSDIIFPPLITIIMMLCYTGGVAGSKGDGEW